MQEKKEFNIEDCIYDKSRICPICENEFKSREIKKGKTRFVELDLGLRSIYAPIVPDYYNVIMCDECGYSAIEKRFNNLTLTNIKNVRNKRNTNYVPPKYPAIYDIEIAIDRFKKALYFCYMKESDLSEKAYICNKLANLYSDLKDEKLELEYRTHAYNGYKEAYINEKFPIMDMEEEQLLYTIAYLAYKIGKKDEAKKVLGGLIVKKTISYILKEKIQEFIEILKEEN